MSASYMIAYKKSGIWTEDLDFENSIIKTLFDKVFHNDSNQINWQDLNFFCELYEIKDIEIVVELICHIRDESVKYINLMIDKKQKNIEDEIRFKSYSKVRY